MSKHPGWLWRHKLKIVLGLLWLMLFFAGLLNFAGSRLVYTVFSITSLAMLLSGVYRQVSYGYLFLVIFLWLDFWFKLTANFLLFGYFPFSEPVGSFNSSPDAWNQVLWIAMAGSMGAMLDRFLYALFRPKPSADTARAKAPSWYPSLRVWLWAGTLLKAAKEKREAGKITLYQGVRKSHYRWTYPNVWQFASLPGAAGFLYYSGSMWEVLLGMGLFSAVVLMGEYLIFRVTGNPLLCGLIGLALANTVAQLGIAPRQDFPYYVMIACGILVIGLIQSRFFTRLLEKLRLLKIGAR